MFQRGPKTAKNQEFGSFGHWNVCLLLLYRSSKFLHNSSMPLETIPDFHENEMKTENSSYFYMCTFLLRENLLNTDYRLMSFNFKCLHLFLKKTLHKIKQWCVVFCHIPQTVNKTNKRKSLIMPTRLNTKLLD